MRTNDGLTILLSAFKIIFVWIFFRTLSNTEYCLNLDIASSIYLKYPLLLLREAITIVKKILLFVEKCSKKIEYALHSYVKQN